MINRKELKEERLKRGLSQVEMAVIVGVTENTYRNWELGANNPSEENLKKLEEALSAREEK